jgi:hypothetical protein
MISYTIDKSIFNPPAIPSIEDKKVINYNMINEYDEKMVRYADNIRKVNEIKDIEGIVVYLFNPPNLSLPTDYVKKAININKSNFPIDLIKKIMDKLSDLYFPDPDPDPNFNDNRNRKYYSFDDGERFNFKELRYKNARIEPDLQNKNGVTSEDEKQMVKIGILNYYIYKKPSIHFLVKDKAGKYSVSCTNLKFNLNILKQNEEKIKLNIEVVNIDDIISNNNYQFKNIYEAYKQAKILFSDYIVFGKDVEEGVNEIINSKCLSERIFYYLQTLKEFCEYKRKIKTEFSDDFILRSFGCDCSYEKPNHMQDENVRNDRMFDNGYNEKDVFDLHLKPSTIRNGTTRIHILWDKDRGKVIVGWIGKHRCLPPKNH